MSRFPTVVAISEHAFRAWLLSLHVRSMYSDGFTRVIESRFAVVSSWFETWSRSVLSEVRDIW